MNDLQGARILVTRPAHQANDLCSLIEQHGGIAVRFPTIEIVGMSNWQSQANIGLSATNALPELSNYQWLIFTSANAVNFALQAKSGKIQPFMTARIAAIGQATAKALELAGLKVNLVPGSGHDSESLLAMPPLQEVNGQAILIVKGHGGRDALADGLRLRGGNIDCWDVYKRTIANTEKSEVIDLLDNNLINSIIITSFEALQNLLTLIGLDYQQKLAIIPLVVISARIKKLAAELGFTRIAVAESPSDAAVVEAAIAIINGESCG